jgi:hypothetical protein
MWRTIAQQLSSGLIDEDTGSSGSGAKRPRPSTMATQEMGDFRECLQAQFTTAADAVNRLLHERQQLRSSRWTRWGRMLGPGPAVGDDLP